ncbi:MAG: hypothetical protein O7A09_07590 [Proteobacteria bacterium]|nr:hypothetical protein [Pseudomonadota bacterium]
MRIVHCPLPAFVSLLVLLSSGWGCAFGEFRPHDPLRREYSLELAQNDYTLLVRWSEFGKAAGFVDPELRDDFRSGFPDSRQLRFTDFESGSIDLDEEKKTATVEVTYFGYPTNSPIEIEITETQEWYRDSVTNNWQVRPTFNGLEGLNGVSAER